ncbi:cytochrome P450 [Xylariaceae sp. FL0016]|nr:cytochrome P450 [Xylariaceae sp. FL0016]
MANITTHEATVWDTVYEKYGATVQGALILSATFVVAYQLLFHPLRTYPGPWLAKFTDAYNGFHTIRGQLHLRTWLNHRKYGSVVRQGPNKLVFSTTTAVREIYRTDKTTKPKAYIALGPGLTAYNVFTATDNQLHRQRRQLVGQILTDTSMRAFEPTMTCHVDILMSTILSTIQEGTALDISEESRRLGFDIAGQLAFGYDLRLQTEATNRFMLAMITKGTFWSSVFLHYPGARRFRLGLIAVKAFRQLREPYFALMQNMIHSRMAEEVDAKHDLFSRLAPALRANDDDGGGLRDSELWAEANLFLTAAGDTVKTAISAVFFYVSRNQTVYEKLASEIRASFTSAVEINSVALGRCRYLRACIDEALRMTPPAPGILWREQASLDSPFIIDGHAIPNGTAVGVNIYSLHHNEEYFPEPFEYIPERWLEEQGSDAVHAMRDAFMPFSIGPRGCAGKTMAYAETGLVIAKMLWYFDFQKAAGDCGKIGEGSRDRGPGRQRQNEFQTYDVFSSMHQGPFLTFTTRGEFWKQLPRQAENI